MNAPLKSIEISKACSSRFCSTQNLVATILIMKACVINVAFQAALFQRLAKISANNRHKKLIEADVKK